MEIDSPRPIWYEPHFDADSYLISKPCHITETITREIFRFDLSSIIVRTVSTIFEISAVDIDDAMKIFESILGQPIGYQQKLKTKLYRSLKRTIFVIVQYQ